MLVVPPAAHQSVDRLPAAVDGQPLFRLLGNVFEALLVEGQLDITHLAPVLFKFRAILVEKADNFFLQKHVFDFINIDSLLQNFGSLFISVLVVGSRSGHFPLACFAPQIHRQHGRLRQIFLELDFTSGNFVLNIPVAFVNFLGLVVNALFFPELPYFFVPRLHFQLFVEFHDGLRVSQFARLLF